MNSNLNVLFLIKLRGRKTFKSFTKCSFSIEASQSPEKKLELLILEREKLLKDNMVTVLFGRSAQ